MANYLAHGGAGKPQYIMWSAGPTLCQSISRIIFLGLLVKLYGFLLAQSAWLCSPSGWRLPLLVFNRKHHSHYTVLPPSNLRRPFACGSRQYVYLVRIIWNTDSQKSLFSRILALYSPAWNRLN